MQVSDMKCNARVLTYRYKKNGVRDWMICPDCVVEDGSEEAIEIFRDPTEFRSFAARLHCSNDQDVFLDDVG